MHHHRLPAASKIISTFAIFSRFFLIPVLIKSDCHALAGMQQHAIEGGSVLLKCQPPAPSSPAHGASSVDATATSAFVAQGPGQVSPPLAASLPIPAVTWHRDGELVLIFVFVGLNIFYVYECVYWKLCVTKKSTAHKSVRLFPTSCNSCALKPFTSYGLRISWREIVIFRHCSLSTTSCIMAS